MQLILTAEAFAVNILAGAGADRPRAYAAALGAPFAEKSHRGFDFYLSALGHIEPKRSAEDRAIDLAFAAFQSAAVEAFRGGRPCPIETMIGRGVTSTRTATASENKTGTASPL